MGHHSPHDHRSTERLITGAGADPADAHLAGLLDGLRVGPLECELERETRSVAHLAAAICVAEGQPQPRPERGPVNTRLRILVAGALVAGALAATSGLAYAGALPGAAQDTAAGVLSRLGISVPGPNSHAGTHPDVRGSSTQASASDSTDQPGDSGSGSDQPQQTGKGKGATISQLARTTTATGRDKGQVISTAASGGKSHAGNPPGQSGSHGSSGSHQPSGHDPSTGGTGTADQHSGGHDSHGSSTAGTHSGGHSTAGSGNAGSHGPN